MGRTVLGPYCPREGVELSKAVNGAVMSKAVLSKQCGRSVLQLKVVVRSKAVMSKALLLWGRTVLDNFTVMGARYARGGQVKIRT